MRRLLALTCIVLACESPPPAPAPTAAPAPTPTSVTAPQPVAPSELPLDGLGPGGASGRESRRQAVLDLLTDGRSAAALTEIAAEPDHPFDAGLADALTPRVRVGIPQVRQGPGAVTGPIDHDVVRRIVRAHINEIRHCYNQGLHRDPAARGRVVVNFEILMSGAVRTSRISESTITDPQVPECIAKAVRRWLFPEPAAVVKVSYPFELEPA